MASLFKREKQAAAPLTQPVQAKIPEVQDAEFAAFYYGQRRGGDFYDFVRVSDRRVVFGLLDIAGPLLDNRTILCALQDTFRTQGALLFANDDINESEAMIELGIRLNHSILDAAGGVRSCPAFLGCYDETVGIITYVNSGHTPGLVRGRDGIAELHATGLPLGLFSHAPSDASVVVLEPGASLLLLSRGVLEGKHKGEEFGMPRATEAFQQTTADSPKELCIAILNSLRQFMGTPPTHDDVTALALVRPPIGGSSLQSSPAHS